jgi:hypothetical protein
MSTSHRDCSRSGFGIGTVKTVGPSWPCDHVRASSAEPASALVPQIRAPPEGNTDRLPAGLISTAASGSSPIPRAGLPVRRATRRARWAGGCGLKSLASVRELAGAGRPTDRAQGGALGPDDGMMQTSASRELTYTTRLSDHAGRWSITWTR